MYCVNSWYPNYGCGQYTVSAGDVIEWNIPATWAVICQTATPMDMEKNGKTITTDKNKRNRCMRYFENLHPICILLYFVAVIGLTLACFHPVMLVVSLAGASAFSCA